MTEDVVILFVNILTSIICFKLSKYIFSVTSISCATFSAYVRLGSNWNLFGISGLVGLPAQGDITGEPWETLIFSAATGDWQTPFCSNAPWPFCWRGSCILRGAVDGIFSFLKTVALWTSMYFTCTGIICSFSTDIGSAGHLIPPFNITEID